MAEKTRVKDSRGALCTRKESLLLIFIVNISIWNIERTNMDMLLKMVRQIFKWLVIYKYKQFGYGLEQVQIQRSELQI